MSSRVLRFGERHLRGRTAAVGERKYCTFLAQKAIMGEPISEAAGDAVGLGTIITRPDPEIDVAGKAILRHDGIPLFSVSSAEHHALPGVSPCSVLQ